MTIPDSTTEPPLKRCTACQQELPFTCDYFAKDNRMHSGLKPLCIECNRAKVRQWRADNPEKSRNTVKKWIKAHPDKHREYGRATSKRRRECDPERMRALDREYKKREYAKNPQKILDRNKQHRMNNPDKVRASIKNWYINNPEKVRLNNQRRLTRKRGLPVTFTEQDWQRALEYFHGCCAYCGNPPSMFDKYPVLHQDHFKPLSKGGGYTPDNIIPACQACNNSKYDKLPEQWLIECIGARKAKAVLKRIHDYLATYLL